MVRVCKILTSQRGTSGNQPVDAGRRRQKLLGIPPKKGDIPELSLELGENPICAAKL